MFPFMWFLLKHLNACSEQEVGNVGVFRNKYRSCSSGGRINQDFGTLSLLCESCTFDSISDLRAGGAISTGAARVTIKSCTFQLCSSLVGGGALALYQSTATIKRTEFNVCTGELGMDIWVTDTGVSKLTLMWCCFNHNTVYGAYAIFVVGQCKIKAIGSVFSDSQSYIVNYKFTYDQQKPKCILCEYLADGCHWPKPLLIVLGVVGGAILIAVVVGIVVGMMHCRSGDRMKPGTYGSDTLERTLISDWKNVNNGEPNKQV